MKKILSVVGVFGGLLLPVVAFAQGYGNYGNLSGVSGFVNNLIAFTNKTLVPLVFAVAFIVFLWGVLKIFILGGADETKRAEGKNLVLYSIIGFLLMVSLWGIVNLVSSGFGFANESIQRLPSAPGGQP